MAPQISVTLETVAVIWIVCTAAALFTWQSHIDLGPPGLLFWLVFIAGVIYAVDRFLRK